MNGSPKIRNTMTVMGGLEERGCCIYLSEVIFTDNVILSDT
jgi:hypothetical protein